MIGSFSCDQLLIFRWLWRHATVSNLLRFSIESRNTVFVEKIVNCNLFTHGRKHLGVLKNSLKRVGTFQIFTSTNGKTLFSIIKTGLKRIKEVLVSCALIPFKSYNTILGQICRHVGRNLSRDVRKKNFRQGVLVWWSFVCNNWKQFVRGNDKETCPCYVTGNTEAKLRSDKSLMHDHHLAASPKLPQRFSNEIL